MRTEYSITDKPVPGKRRGILTEKNAAQSKSFLLRLVQIIGYKMIPAECWPFLRQVCKQFSDALPAQQMCGPLPVIFYNFQRSRLHSAFTSSLSHSAIALVLKLNNG